MSDSSAPWQLLVNRAVDQERSAHAEALRQLISEAAALIGVAESSVLIPAEDESQLRFLVSTNPEIESKAALLRVGTEGSIAGYVYNAGQTLAVEDAASDELHDKTVDQALGTQTHEYLAVPIVQQQRVLGVLSFVNRVGDRGRHAFEPRHLQAAEEAADLAGRLLPWQLLRAAAVQRLCTDLGMTEDSALEPFGRSPAYWVLLDRISELDEQDLELAERLIAALVEHRVERE